MRSTECCLVSLLFSDSSSSSSRPQWRSQRGRGVGRVQTPSIEKGVHFYCLVIQQKQRLIIENVATKCRILRLKYTKFRIRLGLRRMQTTLGELTALRQTPLLDLRGPTSEGKEESGRENESVGGDKGERGGGGDLNPLHYRFLATPPVGSSSSRTNTFVEPLNDVTYGGTEARCLQIQPNKFPGDFQDTSNKVPGGFFYIDRDRVSEVLQHGRAQPS